MVELGKLFRLEFGQHPIRDVKTPVAADADFETGELFGSEAGGDGFQSVLTSGTPLFAKADFSKIHIYVVRKDQYVHLRIEFVKSDERGNGFPGEVHVCQRLQEENLFASGDSLRQKSLEFGSVLEIGKSVGSGKIFQSEKSDIVTGKPVFWTGVSESDEQFHEAVLVRSGALIGDSE